MAVDSDKPVIGNSEIKKLEDRVWETENARLLYCPVITSSPLNSLCQFC